MNAEQKNQWIKDQRCRAIDAIRELSSAKKQRVSEYDERTRKLKSFEEFIAIKQSDSSQMEMFEPDSTFTPELAALLESPLHGLD